MSSKSRTSSASSRRSSFSASESDEEPPTKRSRISRVAGTILRIRLEDFMCHHFFEWKITAPINFVIGANGSGKSSILQGLVLGLLGNTKDIKRYTRLTNFVKKECSKAVIEVVLSNSGEESYRPEFYGDRITFCRQIYASGKTILIIKGSDDLVRKNYPKDEPRRILDAFKIYVDNPLVILHQETAKELLNVEKPENLFKFFMKASMLDEITYYYQEADKVLKDVEKNIQWKERNYHSSQEEFDRLKVDIKAIEEKKEKIAALGESRKEYACAVMHHNKHLAHQSKLKLEELEESRINFNNTLENLGKDKSALQYKIDAINKRIDIEKAGTSKKEEEFYQIQNKEENARHRLNVLKSKIRDADAEIEEIKKEKDLRLNVYHSRTDPKKIQERKLRKESRARKLEEIEVQIEENRQKVTREGEKLQDLRVKDDEQEKEILDMRHRMGILKREIEDYERQKSELSRSNASKRLLRFGRDPYNIDIGIQENRKRFTKTPIGPVGMYVTLRPELPKSWANVIESFLGAGFRAYLCDNSADCRELFELFKSKQVHNKPKVFTSKFLKQRHDRRSNFKKVQCKHPTLIDLLQVENDIVYNYLIDQFNLESIVMCSTQAEAKLISTRIEQVPDNMTMVLTSDGYKFFPPTRRSSYRSYYMDIQTARYLGLETDEQHQKENVKDSRCDELKELKKRHTELEKKLTKTKNAIIVCDDAKKEANERYNEARRIKNSVMSESGDDLDENLEDFERMIQKLEGQIKGKDIELITLKDEKEEVCSELQELSQKKEKLVDVMQKMRSKQAELDRLEKEKQELIQKKNYAMKQMKIIELKQRDILLKIESCNKENEKAIKRLEESMKKAEAMTENQIFEPKEDIHMIRERMNLLRKQTRNTEGSSFDGKLVRFKTLNAQLKKEKEDIEYLQAHLKSLSKQSTARKSSLMVIRKTIARTSMRSFNMLSGKFEQKLGCTMKLAIDLSKRRIEIRFCDGDGNQLQQKELSTLSGGEKSYAQMCLILSMWESLQSPFRVLDEWDVYLDHVNRVDISKELLLRSIRKEDVQTIMISPQGATDIRTHLSRDKQHLVEIREIFKQK